MSYMILHLRKAGPIILLALILSACSATGTSTTNAPTAAPASTDAAIAAPATSAPTPAELATSAPAATQSTDAPAPTAVAANAPTAVPTESAPSKLNLNDATADQFLTIPGVGNRMVREFMEYRPYTSILQFRREIGKYVDSAQVSAYEQYVFVPIDVNQADADTLKQIDGVDDTIATNLISSRPFSSKGDFLAKLATYIASEQATAAAYLVLP